MSTVGQELDLGKLHKLKRYLTPAKLRELDPLKRQELETLIRALENRTKQRKFFKMYPGGYESGYIKHLNFMRASEHYRELAMISSNRSGKSVAGAYMMTCFATGIYPDWWEGRRFNKPVKAWVAGDNAKTVRDILQIELLGPHDSRGTGMIPGEHLVRTTPKAGVPDALDTIYVKHLDDQGDHDGMSMPQFKSYDQGRIAFQGTEQDVIHLDEECPIEVYTECLIRTMTTKGLIYLTFTPLSGLTPLVLSFLPSGQAPSMKDEKPMPEGLQGYAAKGKYVIQATWDDAPHLSEEEKEQMFNALPPHQRDARSKGIPALGSGAIYPVPESEITVEPFPIPDHYEKINGFDVGWNCTAAAFGARDPDSGVMYIYDVYRKGQAEPSVHAHALKQRGEWIPTAIDPAARGRGQKDGESLWGLYFDLGLDLVKAVNAVEAGIYEVFQALQSGMLKVFSTCTPFFEEYRIYRRDEKGKIVKENDHVMDAARYLFMTRTAAMQKPMAPEDFDDVKTSSDEITGY